MRSRIWKLIGLAISLGIAFFLLRQLDLEAFAGMVRRVPAWSLLAALASYLLLNTFRLRRFRLLLDGGEIPFRVFYPIVLYHNFLVRMLPFKTGELSYIVLLRQYLQRPIREGVSSLVASRLFELFLVIVVGGGALLLAADESVLLLEIVLVLGGAVFFLLVLYFSGDLLRLGGRVLRSVSEPRWDPVEARHVVPLQHKFVDRVAGAAEKLDSLALAFDRVRAPRVFRAMLFWSLLTYSMSLSFNLVLLFGLGIETDPGLLIGIISIVMLTEALPLATISGLGMVEGGWTFGLVAFAGFAVDEAAALGFFLHGCQLLAAATTGLVGYLWLQRYNVAADLRRKELG